MLFTKLKLNYFGRFHEKEIDLQPGFNLIYGENEAGKSTLHTFIKGMLFGIERLRGRGSASKEDYYTRYLPWSYPGAFGGSMDIEIADKKYRLTRSFHANDKRFTVLDLTTGREVKLKEGMISELLPGLTESTFRNTISIEQLKAQTDAELAALVRNYIANLSIAKSKEVNVAKAVSNLNNQRKLLEASVSTAEIKALQTEIDEGMSREKQLDQLTFQLQKKQQEEQQLLNQKETFAASFDHEAMARLEQFPAILEKYRSYQEQQRQAVQLEALEEELKKKIMYAEREQRSVEDIKEDKRQAETLNIALTERGRQLSELCRETRKAKLTRGKSYLFSLLPGTVIAILALILTGLSLLGIGLAAVLFSAGIVACVLLLRGSSQKLSVYEAQRKGLEQDIIRTTNELNDIYTRNQAESVEALGEKQETILKNHYVLENTREQLVQLEQRRTQLEDSKDAIYETIMKYMQYFMKEEELTSQSMQHLQEELMRRKQESSGRQSQLNKQQEDCRLALEKLRWEISKLADNEGQLLRNQERLKALTKQQRENAVELEAIKLALSSIQELSSDIHDGFGQQLNHAVSEVISEVTKERYHDLKIDEKLEVLVGWNGDYILLERLSAGTIEQVYFALRIAVADLLLGKDEVPLLLDDSFALYDDNRVQAAIKELAKRRQILMFTCHKREQAVLNELGIPYHLVDLSA